MSAEAMASEVPLDASLPIVDAHHHLWLIPEARLEEAESARNLAAIALAPMYRSKARYLLDELLDDVGSGHNVQATVYVEGRAMYRRSGPEYMKSVGEIEYANGVAAMGASGLFGDVRVCAAIVGAVDLMRGDEAEEVLEAHIEAGNGRYRGVRSPVVYDPDPAILGGAGEPARLVDRGFRSGVRLLERLDLSLDVWLFEPQLPELVELARACPEVSIALNHLGTPLAVGRLAGEREARFPVWRDNIIALADCENVVIKLGGLGVPFGGFASYLAQPPFTSAQLADEWRPYIETCIDAFGVQRCMFESNYPVDSATAPYCVIWNAFKRLTVGASPAERHSLFSETATRFYRLNLE